MTDPRPKLSWSDLPGARVGVWGLGREGHANLRKLRALGVEPVLVDDHPGDPGVLATGDGGLAALERCDVVVKTPGLSRYRPEVARFVQQEKHLLAFVGNAASHRPQERRNPHAVERCQCLQSFRRQNEVKRRLAA